MLYLRWLGIIKSIQIGAAPLSVEHELIPLYASWCFLIRRGELRVRH